MTPGCGTPRNLGLHIDDPFSARVCLMVLSDAHSCAGPVAAEDGLLCGFSPQSALGDGGGALTLGRVLGSRSEREKKELRCVVGVSVGSCARHATYNRGVLLSRPHQFSYRPLTL